MGKSIELMSVACLTFLLLGCLFMPANSMLWLATATSSFLYARLALITLLGLLLILGVPSSRYFRFGLSVVGLSLFVWSAGGTYNETLAWLDGLALMAAAVSMLKMSLEPAAVRAPKAASYSLFPRMEPLAISLRRQAMPYIFAIMMVASVLTQTQSLKDTYSRLLSG